MRRLTFLSLGFLLIGYPAVPSPLADILGTYGGSQFVETHIRFKLSGTSVKFPWVHTVVSNCKNQLKGSQRGVSLKHAHRYLSEYCYHLNRRFWEDQLFERLLSACSLSPTISYTELTG